MFYTIKCNYYKQCYSDYVNMKMNQIILQCNSYFSINQIIKIFQDVYTMPYIRAGPWLVGMLLGYEAVKKTLTLTKVCIL